VPQRLEHLQAYDIGTASAAARDAESILGDVLDGDVEDREPDQLRGNVDAVEGVRLLAASRDGEDPFPPSRVKQANVDGGLVLAVTEIM
jgi:hypothetical protein